MSETKELSVIAAKVDSLQYNVDRLTDTISRLVEQGGGTLQKQKPKDPYSTDFSEDENEERGNWTGRLDFLLSCLGYAVGLGNVWRFPYLCYENGGAVFFIPYVIMLFFVGMPIFFMELSLGQYTSSGPLTCWEMATMFKGLGWGMVIVSAMVATYYNVIIAWSLYYMFASFTSDLPWTHCDRAWNTQWCTSSTGGVLQKFSEANCTNDLKPVDGVCFNETSGRPFAIINATDAKAAGYATQQASEQYYKYEVLGLAMNGSSAIDNVGEIEWQLALCLLLAWVVVALCLIKGVKSSGKVVYFTALFPYAILIALLVRAATLPGFEKGVEYYILKIDWEKLKEAKVWKDAAVQIFFSLGSSFGGLLALASYNRFHNDALRDTLLVSIGNCLTSFFAGFVIFGFLGYMAFTEGKDVSDVAATGVGLAFVVYPAGVSQIPISPLWAFLFFFMLILLGLDSEFVFVETVTTALMDQFVGLRKFKCLVITSICLVGFLLGLVMTTSGGYYWFSLMDSTAGGWNVLLIAVLECICIAYVYGVCRFKQDIRVMLGPVGCCCLPWSCCSYWWMLNWVLLSPLIILAVLMFSWVNLAPIEVDGAALPDWAQSLGLCISLTVVVSVVVTPIVLMCMIDGSFMERLRYITTPTEMWGPALPRHRVLVRHLPDFMVDPHGVVAEDVSFDIKMQVGTRNSGYLH